MLRLPGGPHLQDTGRSTGEPPRSISSRRGTEVWWRASAGGWAVAPGPTAPAAWRGPGTPEAAIHSLPDSGLPGSPVGRERAGMQAAGVPQEPCTHGGQPSHRAPHPPSHAHWATGDTWTPVPVPSGTAGAAAPCPGAVQVWPRGWECPTAAAAPRFPRRTQASSFLLAPQEQGPPCWPLGPGGCCQALFGCSANGAARLAGEGARDAQPPTHHHVDRMREPGARAASGAGRPAHAMASPGRCRQPGTGGLRLPTLTFLGFISLAEKAISSPRGSCARLTLPPDAIAPRTCVPN